MKKRGMAYIFAGMFIIGAVALIAAPAFSLSVTFYKDSNYAGTATQAITATGTYTLTQLQAKGFVNDWASSARISGCVVVMYKDNNFTGETWVLRGDTPNFPALSPSANDVVTSIAIYPLKSYDLVLLHGLTNKHKWSDAFLDHVAGFWGSGNVYVIYTNESTRVWTRTINGRVITFCGEDDFGAGDEYVQDQAALMNAKILLLRNSYGLSTQFDLIAHSMGGLVGRYYAFNYQDSGVSRLRGFVSLGTPHHGSSLAVAADFMFLDYFVGAQEAMEHLKPDWVNGTFNSWCPLNSTPLNGATLKQVVGDADGIDCWGWGGELFAGWPILGVWEGDNDGLVSHQSARLDGIDNHSDSTDIKFFWDYDHQELVQEKSVAIKASSWLP